MQESIIKLLTGMNNDFNPLNFRGKYLTDKVTEDPYYKVAPGWSSLSGGRHPFVTKAPADIADMVKRACDCVPFVRSVRFYIVQSNGVKEQISLDGLKLRDIKIQGVPNLWLPRAPSSTGKAAAPSESERAAIAERNELREEVKMLRDHLKDLENKMSAAASASSSTRNIIVDDDDDDDVGANASGKRARTD